MERYFLPRPEVIGQGAMALNQKRISIDWAQGRNYLGWNKLPREVVDSPWLEMLMVTLDGALRDRIWFLFMAMAGEGVELHGLQMSYSNPNHSVIQGKMHVLVVLLRKLLRTWATQVVFEGSGLKQTACVVYLLFSCLVLCVLDFILARPSCFGGQTLYHFLKFAWKQRSDWHRKLIFCREQSVSRL